MANLKGSKTEDNLKAAFAGESQANRRYLYFAQKADVEGYNDVAAVFRSTAEGETGHAHGHLEFLEVSRRPGDRPADRPDRLQPQGRDRGRDARIHRHVSGHGAHGARRRLRRNRRLVRDAGQGREEPRRPLPEGARHDGLSLSGFAKGTRAGPLFRPYTAATKRHRPCAKAASKRPPATPSTGRTRGSATRSARSGDAARLRHLPRLPALLQSVRFLPAAVRPDRQRPDRRTRRREEGGLRPGRRGLHALRHVLHDEVPLCAAARIQCRFPASDAAPSRGAGAQERHRLRRAPARRDRSQRQARHASPPLANWATDEAQQADAPGRSSKFAGIDHGARLPQLQPARPSRSAPRAKQRAVNEAAPAFGKRKAVLYATCFVNYNNPDIGEAARAVLAKNGVETEVVYPACCGMPQLEQGDIERVAAAARQVTAALLPWIDKGYDVVALMPSCALMLKFEWPLILPEDRRCGAPVAGDLRLSRICRRHRQERRPGARASSRSRAASACISPAMRARRIWAPRRPRCCAWCPRRGSP